MKAKIISISEDEEDENKVIMADFIKEKMFDLESEINDDFNTLPDFSKFLSESSNCDGVNDSSQNENEKTDNKEIEVVKDDILSSSSNLSDDIFGTTNTDKFSFSLPMDEDIMIVPEFNLQMENFIKKRTHPRISNGFVFINYEKEYLSKEAVTKNGFAINKLVEKMVDFHNKSTVYSKSVDAVALVYDGVCRVGRDANIDVSKKQFASYVFLDPIFMSCINEIYVLLYADVPVCPKCLNFCNDSNICDGTIGIFLLQACYILNFVRKVAVRDIFKILRHDNLNFANGDAVNLANRVIAKSGLVSSDHFKARWKLLGELEDEGKLCISDASWIKQIADLSTSSDFSSDEDYIKRHYSDEFLVEYSRNSIFYHLRLVKMVGMCFRCFGRHLFSVCPYDKYKNIGLLLLFNYWASNTVMKAENLTADADSLFSLYMNVSLIKRNGIPLAFNHKD